MLVSNPNVLRLIAGKLSNSDLYHLCSLSSILRQKICQNDLFWQYKISLDFPWLNAKHYFIDSSWLDWYRRNNIAQRLLQSNQNMADILEKAIDNKLPDSKLILTLMQPTYLYISEPRLDINKVQAKYTRIKSYMPELKPQSIHWILQTPIDLLLRADSHPIYIHSLYGPEIIRYRHDNSPTWNTANAIETLVYTRILYSYKHKYPLNDFMLSSTLTLSKSELISKLQTFSYSNPFFDFNQLSQSQLLNIYKHFLFLNGLIWLF